MKTSEVHAVDAEIGALPERASAVKVQGKTGDSWRQLMRPRDDGAGQTLFALEELPLASVGEFAHFCMQTWGAGLYRVQFFKDVRGQMKLAGTGRVVHVQKGKKKIAAEAPTRPDSPNALEAERRALAAERERLTAQREAWHEREKAAIIDNAKTLVDIIRAQPPPVAAAPGPSGPSAEEIRLMIENERLKSDRVHARKRARIVRKLRAARANRYAPRDDDDDDDRGPGLDIFDRNLGAAAGPVRDAVKDYAPDLLRAAIEWVTKAKAMPPAGGTS